MIKNGIANVWEKFIPLKRNFLTLFFIVIFGFHFVLDEANEPITAYWNEEMWYEQEVDKRAHRHKNKCKHMHAHTAVRYDGRIDKSEYASSEFREKKNK